LGDVPRISPKAFLKRRTLCLSGYDFGWNADSREKAGPKAEEEAIRKAAELKRKTEKEEKQRLAALEKEKEEAALRQAAELKRKKEEEELKRFVETDAREFLLSLFYIRTKL